MLNSFKELCITQVAAINSFAKVLNPLVGAYSRNLKKITAEHKRDLKSNDILSTRVFQKNAYDCNFKSYIFW